MISAILDNATLTAAEISPAMSQRTDQRCSLRSAHLRRHAHPGNIPNIISAGKLGITSSEWAKLGVPLGLIINAIYL